MSGTSQGVVSSSAGCGAATDPFGHEGQAEDYATFRPSYPDALLEDLWSRPGGAEASASSNALAVDACCGTGQLTVELAPHFAKVLGLDRSREQLRHAKRSASNIEYRLADAALLETVEPCSADLVTIAQGLHWLDIPAFSAAAHLALRPGGCLAILGYGVCSVAATGSGDAAGAAFEEYYKETLGSHLPLRQKGCWWDCDRRLLDSGFEGADFAPFGEVRRRWHFQTRQMSIDDFMRYLGTWSAYRSYVAERGAACDPLTALRAQLESAAESLGCRILDVTLPYFLIVLRKEGATEAEKMR